MKTFARVLLIVACGSLSAATTHTIKVNADGSFSPPVLTISAGDTVEWTLSASSDSIIPISWDVVAANYCSAIKSYAPNDPSEFTGPMPLAASGIFALSPLSVGYKIEPASTLCANGQPPRATGAGQMLCAAGSYEATMDATWQDPALTGVFIRLLWKDIQTAAGTDDASFDFTVLDREVNKAVKNGKLYSIGIKAGDDGTPSWLFTNGGVTPLQLQDNGSDNDASGCGSRMTLGNPTEPAYQNRYFDLLRKVAAHLKSRADWYRSLAYVKPSGANLFSHENRLPKRCDPGCTCNTQVFAQHGYTPAKLYSFYQAQFDLIASEFPNKTMCYALIQDGFPLINDSGDYMKSDGTSSGAALPGRTEQTQAVIDLGQAREGLLFADQHNGLNSKITDNCATNLDAPGCPHRYVIQEGNEGQVTGWQTTNAEKVSNPVDTDSALQNAYVNSRGVFVELYEERYWEAVHQPNGIISPAGSGKTMSQWVTDFQNRRRTLFPQIPDPAPTIYRFTFTAATAGKTFYYVHGAKCGIGNATPASIVVSSSGTTTPVHRRSTRH